MKNIRFLSNRVEKKGTTEYAVFFEHEGIYARLDWELSDDAEVDPNHMSNLMLKQLELDLADEVLVEEIREKNTRDTDIPSRLDMLLDSGWMEHAATDFKEEAIRRFGSE